MKDTTIQFLNRRIESSRTIKKVIYSDNESDYNKGYYQGRYEELWDIVQYLENHEGIKILGMFN